MNITQLCSIMHFTKINLKKDFLCVVYYVSNFETLMNFSDIKCIADIRIWYHNNNKLSQGFLIIVSVL